MIKKTDRIFLAGHKGLVGSAILKLLKKKIIKILLPSIKINLIYLTKKKF